MSIPSVQVEFWVFAVDVVSHVIIPSLLRLPDAQRQLRFAWARDAPKYGHSRWTLVLSMSIISDQCSA